MSRSRSESAFQPARLGRAVLSSSLQHVAHVVGRLWRRPLAERGHHERRERGAELGVRLHRRRVDAVIGNASLSASIAAISSRGSRASASRTSATASSGPPTLPVRHLGEPRRDAPRPRRAAPRPARGIAARAHCSRNTHDGSDRSSSRVSSECTASRSSRDQRGVRRATVQQLQSDRPQVHDEPRSIALRACCSASAIIASASAWPRKRRCTGSGCGNSARGSRRSPASRSVRSPSSTVSASSSRPRS